MTTGSPPLLIRFGDDEPEIAPDAWIASGAAVIGRVSLGSRASVWYGSVLRADGDAIQIGAGSNVQDGCVIHADPPGFPVVLGSGVSVGHRAVLHGAVVEDDVLIGMGAVLLNGVRIGRGSLVAAGTVLLEGTQVPPRSLVAGMPGRVRRELRDAEQQLLRDNAREYEIKARQHAEALRSPATNRIR
jgi:carbonic anhydrase/acetyltransferase-like protein (isoleucine patch superfamily)